MESTMIFTVSVEARQIPFEMVQTNELIPRPKPVTVLLLFDGLVMIPLPLLKVQIPVPETGSIPAKITEGVL